MSSILAATAAAVAGAAANKVFGGNETSTSVDRPAWLDSAMQGTIADLQNSPVAQVNPDNVTAGMNPYLMEALAQAGTYAQGAGADQVAMMNLMGMNQAGVGNQLEALAAAQAGYGSQALDGAGGWIMNELAANMSDPSRGGGASQMMGNGGYGGGGGFGNSSPTLGGDLKFKYDQGTFDQSYGNLVGVAQNAFDSFSNKTKTNNLFNNLPQLKMGSQLLGGANTKVGQQSSLLDALTNQQIVDFGAQQAQWAGGAANNAAMAAGQGNQNTALGQYSTDVQAATSRANAAMAAATSAANARLSADTSRYNALVGAATNMYGYGSGMMGDAGTSLTNADGAYGNAGTTFGNANIQATNNMNTSLTAGNYIQNYDQNALDRWNNTNVFNTQQPFNMNLDMFNAYNGTPTGSTTSESLGALQAAGQGLTIGGQIMNFPTSDVRLKQNITPAEKVNGVQYYDWEWTEEAKALGVNDATHGVLAQEMLTQRPEAVLMGDHGYFVIDYSKI